jgi:hypothetical protein
LEPFTVPRLIMIITFAMGDETGVIPHSERHPHQTGNNVIRPKCKCDKSQVTVHFSIPIHKSYSCHIPKYPVIFLSYFSIPIQNVQQTY